MTDSEEFARYAEAERRICDEAGPMFATIIRAVEASAGLVIAEVRVTFDRTIRTGDLMSANCTIVRAAPALPLAGHDTRERGHASLQAAGLASTSRSVLDKNSMSLSGKIDEREQTALLLLRRA